MQAKTVKRTGGHESGMVRGTIIKLRRRCGKAQCRCVDGAPHGSWVLSYSSNGRTRMLVVRPDEVPTLQADLRGIARRATPLERQAMAGIEGWRRRRS